MIKSEVISENNSTLWKITKAVACKSLKINFQIHWQK